jgi:bifunctional DNA-binding transcriptional regulator/antitoxin component of YhaV-PrlF toxin-antitoxin module
VGSEYQFEAVRKIGKVGTYFYNVTIPKAIMRGLGWQNRQRVVVAQRGGYHRDQGLEAEEETRKE